MTRVTTGSQAWTSAGATDHVEAHGGPACTDAIAELGGEPVADEHAKRLRAGENVAEPGIHPLVLGTGRRLFNDGLHASLRLRKVASARWPDRGS